MGKGGGGSIPPLFSRGHLAGFESSMSKEQGKRQPIGSKSGTGPRIFIRPQAYRRLTLYITLCPFEVAGLGTVEPLGADLLVSEVFLLRQRASGTDAELDPQAVADHLLHTLRNGGNVSRLRLWWHSHAHGSLYWSETDEETIEGLSIDHLVSIVGNRTPEFECRLDLFSPQRATYCKLPLLSLPDNTPIDEMTLRTAVMAELREKVTLIGREVFPAPELILGGSSTLEIPITFDELDLPPQE